MELVRVDSLRTAASITADVLRWVLDADLVVAYLTGLNPNVMYEIGVRHTVGKPIIQMIDSGEIVPFDVSAVRTIMLDTSSTIRLSHARYALVNELARLAIAAPYEDSPIRSAIDLGALERKIVGRAEPTVGASAEVLIDLLKGLERRLGGLEATVGALVKASQRDLPPLLPAHFHSSRSRRCPQNRACPTA